MIHIPILGRLSLSDYTRLVFAFLFLLLEPILRILFAILPLRWVVDRIRKQLSTLFGPLTEPNEEQKKLGWILSPKVEQAFLEMRSTEDIVTFWYQWI
jgi:hypothetical protein